MNLYHFLQRYSIKSKQIKEYYIYNYDNELDDWYRKEPTRDLSEEVVNFRYDRENKTLHIKLNI